MTLLTRHVLSCSLMFARLGPELKMDGSIVGAMATEDKENCIHVNMDRKGMYKKEKTHDTTCRHDE